MRFARAKREPAIRSQAARHLSSRVQILLDLPSMLCVCAAYMKPTGIV